MESNDKSVEQRHSESCQSCSCQSAENQVEKTCATEVKPEPARPTYVPAVDIIEGENSVTVIADVPGVAEGGVELTVEKNVLTLVAQPGEGKVEGGKLAYSEYGVGAYRRSFVLADGIDKDGITASLKDGVLRVSLPKSAPVSKKITIEAN